MKKEQTAFIPISMLADACQLHRDIAVAEWPDGIPLTKEAIKRAITLDLDIEWTACLLSTKSKIVFENKRDAAWATYKVQRDQVWSKKGDASSLRVEYWNTYYEALRLGLIESLCKK
mgnify:CR=1 FL=1